MRKVLRVSNQAHSQSRLLTMTMQPFSPAAILFASIVSTALAGRGVKRGSLSKSGAVAGWLVGFLSAACGLRGLLVILFYQVGSSATKHQKKLKEQRDATAADASQRGASQVLACSAIAVACSVAHAFLCGAEEEIDFRASPLGSALTCGVIAHYATCCADTLASELGILSPRAPILITAPWKSVPPGTNGGITASGTFWSAAGGAIIGSGAVLFDAISGIGIRPLVTISFGALCGVIGSALDSLLGATLQASYFDKDKKLAYSGRQCAPASASHTSGMDLLSNVQVNLISVMMTTALGACVIGPYMFQ